MKHLVYILALCVSTLYGQCNSYEIYESFDDILPTQGGTWTNTSAPYSTTPVRTGSYNLTFNAVNDAIRTPLIVSPGVISFWHRRSSNTTAWTLNVQTSTNGTTWTTRGSVTAPTATWTQYTLNLGALGVTNVYIRLIDARGSGTHERYIDDLSITSAVTTYNTMIPILSACSQTLNSTLTYTLTDNGGPSLGNYSNSLDRTITLTPDDATTLLKISFTDLELETDYDYLYIYDGANTSAPLLATVTGLTIPADITATNAEGQLTIRWTTDISNIGIWGGFVANITAIAEPLPVELAYFEGVAYPIQNILQWATASEHNSSHFVLERSTDAETWIAIAHRLAAGNSNTTSYYSHIDLNMQFVINYYRLIQYDTDGYFEIYGPIALNNMRETKKVIKLVNSLGQTVAPDASGILFEIYEDGSSKKIIR